MPGGYGGARHCRPLPVWRRLVLSAVVAGLDESGFVGGDDGLDLESGRHATVTSFGSPR
jgi:hypothetical protein